MRGIRSFRPFVAAAVVAAASTVVLAGSTAIASHTPPPASVTIAGSLQSELGCPGDWQPDCALTHLVHGSDDVWRGTFTVPAGSWEYKAALNDGWAESYGRNTGADNIPLALGASRSVRFYYDHKSHWITDDVNSTIAVAPGSFQSELGCPGDWDPGCLRSWLQDPDGDGVYSFVTTAIPAGDYEAKVALNESWDVNYGQDGVRNGPNIHFHVPNDGAKVTFTYDATSHVLSILAGHGRDNNVEWDGLRYDSRDTLYRTPGGAVPAGRPVTIRFRTFHDDVTSVKMRLYDVDESAQKIIPMARVASDVSCYQESLAAETCDYWQTTLANAVPDNLWYRFIVTDGTKTAYYADDTAALDGGLGAPSSDPVDQSWALMVYDPRFTAPGWARSAVIYQIFPDRFRNGDRHNDPRTGDPRYDEPVVKKPWGALPEGYCRGYDSPTTSCTEGPRGRDYFGGDLKGVKDELAYLHDLGVNTIYFNPIFEARSNHGYDTADYRSVYRYFGSNRDFEKLAKKARKLGIRLILDGVFNHMSSDSPFFDRYHHYRAVGACESLSSPWRSWFTFTTQNVPCGKDDYVGWFGFDSIPVLNKSNPDVERYFVTGKDSISRLWLSRGAVGWRLDVMGDPSFPSNYWNDFRQVVKQQDPQALIIGELWQKDTTLLRFLRGDRADTTMDYRLRDAVLGFLAPQAFNPKGFADSGHSLTAAQFASRLASIREDYPDAAYYSLMNLLDSHDTARLLWQLTPGRSNMAEREQNAANLAGGKLRQRLASLIQYTLPGAPTVYYGDEVGMTGDDDPDDRRTYPWADTGGHPDTALLAHYRALAALRKSVPALVNGDFRVLFADAADAVAYGRKTGTQAAIVALNRAGSPRTLRIDVGGYLPDGTALHAVYGAGAATVSGGVVTLEVPALAGVVLATGTIDLTPPSAPTGLAADEGNGSVVLRWNAVGGAAAYHVYRSPMTGGGYVRVNAAPVTATSFTDTGLRNARTYYYVVRALDAAGNESGDSNEVAALPHPTIGWSNLQWPPSITHTISAVDRTPNIYGQIWIDGVTSLPGPAPGLRAELGFGPSGSNPAGNTSWRWTAASFNTDVGNNDEYVASLLPDRLGTFDYAYRYSVTDGREWTYADLDGSPNGYSPEQAGKLTVVSSGDTTAPAAPTSLRVVSSSPAAIDLAWDAVTGDPTLYGYEVLRGDHAGGPYAPVELTTATSFTDADVTQGATYYYVVRSVDLSFNRSGSSGEVAATAQARTVAVVFSVTVPATTDATGRTVHVAGTLSRFDGGLPDWDPAAVALTRVDAMHWTITLHGLESTQIEYKYTLGDWDHVEKDASCGEIDNRRLTLSYGSAGTQPVSDSVAQWRNVAPCGN